MYAYLFLHVCNMYCRPISTKTRHSTDAKLHSRCGHVENLLFAVSVASVSSPSQLPSAPRYVSASTTSEARESGCCCCSASSPPSMALATPPYNKLDYIMITCAVSTLGKFNFAHISNAPYEYYCLLRAYKYVTRIEALIELSVCANTNKN